ncbi:MAG: AIR synthase-related protein [Bacteriovoracaceae bacterium]
MNISRIEILPKPFMQEKHPLIKKLKSFFEIDVDKVVEGKIFWIKGTDENLSRLDFWGKELFSDTIVQNYYFDNSKIDLGNTNPNYVLEIQFKPGVTDNSGVAAAEALNLIEKKTGESAYRVFSGKNFYFWTKVSIDKIITIGKELLANDLLEEIIVTTYEDFLKRDRFNNAKIPEVKLGTNEAKVLEVDINLSMDKLLKLSNENCWALSESELEQIKSYFNDSTTKEVRKKLGLPNNPTDVEIEIIAQSWSEHCKHKIFASNIDYTEDESTEIKLGPIQVKSLYKQFIKKSTKDVEEKYKIDWLVSVFSDNAGIVKFDDKINHCIKVETHNSPSALDPYGGALTGILGVNRDILGCGMGAKPIANTDVFCFSNPNFKEELPLKLKHPRRILEGVHLGVEDGGNKSGIPTVNGAFVFDYSFAGKPLVFCGTVGVIPREIKKIKGQDVGDLVIVCGGRIGKDGIHGATFSSLELNEGSPATAVQIGDPITQKRLMDFLIEARNRDLYTNVTDNGAGGLSSSIGEMCQVTNGATIDLKKTLVKYPGLLPYELMISESQERITFAVNKDKKNEFLELAKSRNVEACVLGEYTNTGYLTVYYGDKIIAHLSLKFLHDSLKPMELKARFSGNYDRTSWFNNPKLSFENKNINELVLKVLGSLNVCSKENLVRRYDHEVQASTVMKPFNGKNAKGPSDGGVVKNILHGGSENLGVSISCGINPKISAYDTYLMSLYAADEAVRNALCANANPEYIALVDNFCWPDPLSDQHKLGELVRTCYGLYELALAYGMPFVSGKDSMKNDFVGKFANGKDVKISVLPTLLVTAMGKVENVESLINSSFKHEGDLVYLVGECSYDNINLSEFTEIFKVTTNGKLKPELVDLKKNIGLYKALYKLINDRKLSSIHDVSDGGLICAITESMIGGETGAAISLDSVITKSSEIIPCLFNESTARFIVSVNPKYKKEFEQGLVGFSFFQLGIVTNEPKLKLSFDKKSICEIETAKLSETFCGDLFNE